MKLDGFEILGELGHGGMATVYRARQISLNREVAIKVFEPRFEPTSDDREKFQNEAIVAARLKHPGIVQIHDAVFTGEVYCFVMELVRGYTVSQLAARRGTLDETSLLDIATAVAVALGYAWSQHGVIHCDIKPDNLMVDSDGTIKILDLGLAKTAKALRGTGAEEMVYGTPQYISPEQARGQDDLDCRADIYSLGATLYQLATGRVLFPNVGDAEAVECQINGKAPNPHTQNSKLSLGFCSLLEKMLAKDRVRRQTDWDGVLRDVAAVRAGLPIESGPPLPGSSTIESGPALTFFHDGRPPSGRLVRSPRLPNTQDPMVPSQKASPPVKPPPPPALHEAPVPKKASGRERGMLDELAIALKAKLPIYLGGSLAAVAVVSIAVAAAVVSLRTPDRRNTDEPTPDLDSPITLTLEAIGEKSSGDGGAPAREVSDIPISDTPDMGRTTQPRTSGMAEEGASNTTMDDGSDSEALSPGRMTVAPTEIVDVLADVSVASTDEGSPREVALANVDALRETTASMPPPEVRPMTSLGLGTKRSETSGNAIETGQWTQDYDAALALASDRGIPVLLNFTGSDWCGACIRIHQEVLSREEFLTWSKDRIALVTIDRPNNASLVPPEFRSRNMRLVDNFRIRGYPTFVVLNSDGKEIGRFVGSGDGRSVDSFKRRIVEIAGDLPVHPPKVRTEELMRLLSFSADNPSLKPLEAFSGKLLEVLDRKRVEADAKRKSMHGKIRAAAEKAKDAVQKKGDLGAVLLFMTLIENPEATPEGENEDLSKILRWREENEETIDVWLRQEQTSVLLSAIPSLERMKTVQTKAGRIELAKEIDAYLDTVKRLAAQNAAYVSSSPRKRTSQGGGKASAGNVANPQPIHGTERIVAVDASKVDGVSLGRFEKGAGIIIQYVNGTYCPGGYSNPERINPDSTDTSRRVYYDSERSPRLVGPMQSTKKRMREIPKGTSSKPFAIIVDEPGFYNISAYSGDRWSHWTGTITYRVTTISVIQAKHLRDSSQGKSYQW